MTLIWNIWFHRMKAIRNNIDCFFISACKGSPVPVWIEQGRALTGFRKNLPRCACGIFPESLAQSGTGQRGRQEIKNRLTIREMSNLKIKDMSRSNFTPMKRFYEIIGHYGLRWDWWKSEQITWEYFPEAGNFSITIRCVWNSSITGSGNNWPTRHPLSKRLRGSTLN